MAPLEERIVIAIEEISTSGKRTADAMAGLRETIKEVNDNNLVHHTKQEEEHKLIEELQRVTNKWHLWLIAFLVLCLAFFAGVNISKLKEAIPIL